jgi:hypothetical protein
MIQSKIKWVSLVSVLVIGLSSATAFALPAAATSHNPNSTVAHGQPTAVNAHATNGQANGQAHSSNGKAIACQKRQNAVKTIIGRLDTRIANQLSLFTAVAGRVENFYSKSNNKVANYNQLLANLSTTSSVVRTEYTTLQASSTFSCSTSHPKAIVDSFLGDLKTTLSDLKAYKTAVQNLIVAVAKANNVSLTTKNS